VNQNFDGDSWAIVGTQRTHARSKQKMEMETGKVKTKMEILGTKETGANH